MLIHAESSQGQAASFQIARFAPQENVVMTTYNAQQIIADINAYMKQCGGYNADWYVGIAAKPTERLFNDHRVSEKDDQWIWRRADSHGVARAVEKAYIDAGCDGGPGGGDASTDCVYAYRKSGRTDP